MRAASQRRARSGYAVAAGLVAAALVIAGCGSSGSSSSAGATPSSSKPSSGKVKVALVLPCQPNDLTWCQAGYTAAKRLASEGLISLQYTTDAPSDTASITPILAQYAQKGNQLVIADSTWEPAVLPLAKRFSSTDFANAIGTHTATNVATYNEPIYQAAYLAGMVAAGLSKSGVLGGVAALQIPLCTAELNAFQAGAKRVDPKDKELFTYTGNFNDTGAGQQATLGQARQGADVFVACGNGPSEGMISAIKGTSKLGFTYVGNQSPLAPKNVVGGLDYDLYPYFKAMVDAVKSGTFRPGKAYNLGYAQGAFKLVLNPQLTSRIPKAVLAKMEAVQKQIDQGKFTVPYQPT